VETVVNIRDVLFRVVCIFLEKRGERICQVIDGIFEIRIIEYLEP